MKYNRNISNASSSRLNSRSRVNHVTGTPSTVTLPDELGISITKSVFGWKYPGPSGTASNGGAIGGNTQANTYIDQYGLPFIFVIGGNQILLPPVVKAKGSPVPPLPDGLTVQYAASFMGVNIPGDLFKPICIGGKLTFDNLEMPSAQNAYTSMTSRAAGSWSNAVLINNGVDNGVNKGETLLYIVMSVFQCLIYSYSSYPWGNQYSDMAGQVMTHRNYGNWLSYPLQSGTFFGNVLNDIAPVYTNTIAPIANAAGAALGIPGLGTMTAGAINTAAKDTQNASQTQLVSPALTTYFASGTASSPTSIVLIIAVIGVILFIFMRK